MCRFLVKTYTSKTQRAIDFFYLWVYIYILVVGIHVHFISMWIYNRKRRQLTSIFMHFVYISNYFTNSQHLPTCLFFLSEQSSVVSHIQSALVGFYTINILRRLLEGPPLTMGKSYRAWVKITFSFGILCVKINNAGMGKNLLKGYVQISSYNLYSPE